MLGVDVIFHRDLSLRPIKQNSHCRMRRIGPAAHRPEILRTVLCNQSKFDNFKLSCIKLI